MLKSLKKQLSLVWQSARLSWQLRQIVWAGSFENGSTVAGKPIGSNVSVVYLIPETEYVTAPEGGILVMERSSPLEVGAEGLRLLIAELHRRNVEAGWWTDLNTGLRKNRNVGEMIMLVVTELAEAMEGHRKSLMDDHLPNRKMIEVEFADAIIRLCDIAGGLELDVPGALVEKAEYNAHRLDHKIEARMGVNGKKV